MLKLQVRKRAMVGSGLLMGQVGTLCDRELSRGVCEASSLRCVKRDGVVVGKEHDSGRFVYDH